MSEDGGSEQAREGQVDLAQQRDPGLIGARAGIGEQQGLGASQRQRDLRAPGLVRGTTVDADEQHGDDADSGHHRRQLQRLPPNGHLPPLPRCDQHPVDG